MTEIDPCTLSTHKQRRGVVHASITCLGARLKELESKADQPNTVDLAQRMTQKLETLDSEFRVHHYAIIDLIEDSETLQKEQDTLDEHDNDIAFLAVHVQRFISTCAASSDSTPRKIASRRLLHLQRSLSSVSEAISDLSGRPDDICLLRHHEEQLSDFKKELGEIRNSLLSLDLEESDELTTLQMSLEKGIFDCSLETKRKLLQSHAHDSTPLDNKGVKLPKLDVLIFDGNILNWKSFWEQFNVSIHSRSNLSDTEKLVYLQHSLKEGSAKHVIEGLSHSGEHYAEAIECLLPHYDRPHLIHQTHVRIILEAPSLKDGNGKELCHLHDTMQQHLRTLKAMEYEPSGPFITNWVAPSDTFNL